MAGKQESARATDCRKMNAAVHSQKKAAAFVFWLPKYKSSGISFCKTGPFAESRSIVRFFPVNQHFYLQEF